MAASPAPSALARALPEAVRSIAARLRDLGEEAVVVGGGVRDSLLGRPVLGFWDLATSATPEKVLTVFPRAHPTGIEHGTVTLPVDDSAVEITTYRSEHGYSDARHPDRVTFGVDLAQDLARRDFTVNALAYDPAAEVVLDAHQGLADLEQRVLRAVGSPRERFREDALRPLRCARLAAVLEFDVEPETRAALGEVSDRIPSLSAERVRDELVKMLTAPRPSVGLELLRESGLLELLLPEVARCRGVIQNRHHAHDVYVHTLHAVDLAPADRPRVRWAALLHDLGKPDTRALREDGEATFYGHAQVGAELAVQLLDRLRFAHDERDAIAHLVREHLFDYRPEWTDAAVRRFLRRVGRENLDDLFALRRADAIATGVGGGDVATIEELKLRVARAAPPEQPLAVRELPVSGHDVMRELGIPPGPAVGRILDQLLEEVLEDPGPLDREHLLERVRALGSHLNARGDLDTPGARG